MTKWIFALSLLLLLCCGCAGKDNQPKYTAEELAQIPQPLRGPLPAVTGGFVLAVGSETISSTDITGPLLPKFSELAQKTNYDDFSARAMPAVAAALRDQVADVLLYQQAKKQAGENIDEQLDAATEKEMRKFIVGFGGDYAKAEASLRDYYGMDWEQFRTQKRRMILSGSYLYGQLPQEVPVTYGDIEEYYDAVKDKIYQKEATITIRLIDIDISKVATEPNTPAKKSANKLASEIAKKIKQNQDFAELANQYSNGYRASEGGLWDPVTPGSLAEPYDTLAVKANEMQIGDVTEHFQAGGHIFIMRLEDRQAESEIPLENVQMEIEQRIIEKRKVQVLNKVMDQIVQEAEISGIDAFAQYCVREIYTQAAKQ